MNPRRLSFAHLVATALLLIAGGCGFLISGNDGVVVFNQSDQPLFPLAVDGVEGALIDLNPTPHLAPDDPRIIAPGASRRLEGADILGTFGEGEFLFFFWYLPTDSTVAGRTVFSGSGSTQLRYTELQRQFYQVYYNP